MGWAEAVLGLLLDPAERDAVLGDLEEERRARAREWGARHADRWYRRQVVRSLGPFLWARLGRGREERTMIGSTTGRWLERAWERGAQDVRHSFRLLLRSPGFSAVTLLTLGLGIGAATAVFTVVDGVLLRPLPWHEPDRLYGIGQSGDEGSYWVSAPNFEDLEAGLPSFTLAAYSPEDANLVADGEPAHVEIAEVTGDFFDVLGLEPALGRAFDEEERLRDEPLVVVSHALWQRLLGGRPEALGATMILDGRAREVVGVLPPGPAHPPAAEAWVPLNTASPDWRAARGIVWLQVVGRLRPGADLATARAEAEALGASLRDTYPDVNARFAVGMRSLEEALVGNVETELRVLLAAVLLVLLVTAVNVGGLVLARASTRQAEVHVRTALGCGRRRLAFQFLVESAVLAALGCALGIGLARAGVTLLVAAAPPDTPRLGEVGLDGGALAFALAAGALATLVVGVLPATASLARGAAHLAGGARATPLGTRLRNGLVVVQVALALALLSGAAVVGKSFWRLRQVDPGFDPSSVLVAGLPVTESDFGSPEERALHFDGLLEAALALPGVRAAALTNAAPFVSSGPFFSYEVPGEPVSPEDQPMARFRVVSEGIFETLGIPVLAGRTFAADETRTGNDRVAVVSRELALAHFRPADGDPGAVGTGPGRALGRDIHIAGETYRIVGVVGSIRDLTLREPSPFPHVYVPVSPATRQSMTLLVRGDGTGAELLPALRAEVRRLAPSQPVTPARPLRDFLSDSVARARFTLGLLAFFAAATVLLASLGLYGVLAFTVGRRTREIGVRLALGAERGRLARSVVGQGLRLAALGVSLGVLIALGAAGVLEALLFEVEARDPWVMAGVAAALLFTASVAASVPALRATRIPPSEALRTD